MDDRTSESGENRTCQVVCETRRFGPMACGTRLPCDVHPEGVTEDDGRLARHVDAVVKEAMP